MRFLGLGALLAAVLVLAAQASALGSGGAGSVAPPSASKVGAPVRASLAGRPWVNVVVALRGSGRSLAAAGLGERSVVALQRSVLSRLSPSDFRTTAVWNDIPAFAGLVSRAGLAKLAADPRVVRVDVDSGGHGDDNESLPLIHADVLHTQGVLGAGQTVAILDSGADRANVDLAGAIVAEHCFVATGCPNRQTEQDGPGSAQDDNGHGTNVAGIIASAGKVAPIGVAPSAKLVIVKILDASNTFQQTSQLISALDWLVANHPEVRVVNMSLGTNALFPSTCDSNSALTLALASAINTLRARGTLVFAASGNDAAKSQMEAPACISSTVSVGAVFDADVGFQAIPEFSCADQSSAPDRVTCFSDSSPALDLLAPGDVITSTRLGGGLSSYVGTSQATPQAAGAAALLFSAVPTATADQVESVLKSTGVQVTDPANGRVTPRIDVAAALAALTGSPPPPPAPPPAPPPPPPPVKPPKVHAIASTGRIGSIAQLRFVATSTNGNVRFRLTIHAGPNVIGSFVTVFRKANGTSQSVAWHAPKTAPEKLRFCVKGTDRAGKTSKESCASLTLSA